MSRPLRVAPSMRFWIKVVLGLALGAGLLATTGCGDGDGGGADPGVPDGGVPRFPGAHVVLISIDTLRADRLGTYGYDRGTSPHLDAFAEEAIVFEDAYSNSPKTASSHMSLFTSLPPTVHGVTNASARLGIRLRRVASNRPTLPQLLRRAGYRNDAIACGGNLNPMMGFDKGFEGRFESRQRDVSEIVDRTLRRILPAARAARRPAFLFVHTYQVHGPYVPPDAFLEAFAPNPRGVVAARVDALRQLDHEEQWAHMHTGFWDAQEEFGPDDAAYLSDLYDGEIAYTDQEIGRLLDGLREDGWFDDAIIVVLSDHGEEFAEHGDYQHDQLFDEHLHVPLMIRLPGGVLGGTRVGGLTSLIDVMPTLLELLELEAPENLMGTSLVPAIEAGHTRDVPVLSERVMFADDYRAALRTAESRTTFFAREEALKAWDLSADPEAQHDVAPAAPFFETTSEALLARLTEAWLERTVRDAEETGEQIEVDEETLAELKALGYVGGSELVPEGSPLDRWPRD